jgi:hypothetical protein
MLHRMSLRWWVVPVAVAVIAAHLIVPYAMSHVAMSMTVASIALVLIIIKHLGLAVVMTRSLSGRFRRRP